MAYKVLSVFNRFRYVTVRVKPSIIGKEWPVINDLFIHWRPWICTKIQKRTTRNTILTGNHIIYIIPSCRDATIKESLHVYLRPAFQYKFPVVSKSAITQDFTHPLCHQCRHDNIVLSIMKRSYSAFPYLQEWIRT